MTSTPARGARRRRPVLIPVLAVLAATTVGVSAAFGGMADAPEEPPELLAKGAEFDQGEMRTVFEDAVVRPGGKYEMGVSDKRYLQLILKVTNQADHTILAQAMDGALPTVRTDTGTLQPPATPGDGPYIRSISQNRPYAQLHPGVPTTVVVSFELPPGAPTPKKVSIDLATFEWYESFFTQERFWQRLNGPPEPVSPAPATTAPARGADLPAPKTTTPAVVAARVEMPVRVEAS
ncbi:hypothetical protein Sme01_57610 [Sphaerisporangium melleum]|uniref:DUF4352 domain-containing protein n=1 Tax=Sphaerisporangium melleum TaxID=321316 RepID=A0A917R900_9ACTN|nr:hypothetical protein [Sphaerisporangium melleum]GGK94893.1 hypothetical protein GCM10007964_41490 [Sphaerisporangium melleum]GII73285.1 hypothetical protein Sme01_57610 [Sphaerisporangium melleum]